MHQLMYQEEIKPINEIEGMPGSENSIPSPPVDKREIELGKILVDNLTNKEFDASLYFNDYAKQLEELISAKAEGKIYTSEEKEIEADVGDNLLRSIKSKCSEKQN